MLKGKRHPVRCDSEGLHRGGPGDKPSAARSPQLTTMTDEAAADHGVPRVHPLDQVGRLRAARRTGGERPFSSSP